MFKFDNTHIFTGYLKQLLSSVNLPTCKIYTKDFARYLNQNGVEDPRVIESVDTINKDRVAVRVNYLKNNELFNYFWDYSSDQTDLNHSKLSWKKASSVFYNSERFIPGLTKKLNSHGSLYDTATHEYLGDYLRFLRDYHDINLMSLYNCFNNKIYNNVYIDFDIGSRVVFDSRNTSYHIYAFPVKLFSDYTIAINCDQEIEMFCGLYKTTLDESRKAKNLAKRTYKKINKTLFSQPFIYDKLNVAYWNFNSESTKTAEGQLSLLDSQDFITRWDIANREQDLKLFIKIPTSCKSSIVVLEGNFEHFNHFKYMPHIESSLNMDSCFVGENVTLQGNIAAALRSYVPENKGNNIESFTNCYSLAHLSSESYYGLVGPTRTTNNKIAYCYNANGPIAYANQLSPGLAYNTINSYEAFNSSEPENPNPQYNNASQVVYVPTENMKGAEAFTHMPDLNASNRYLYTADYPILKAFIPYTVLTAGTNMDHIVDLLPLNAEEPTPPENYEIWEQDAISKPKISDDDGWFEITNGAELAYVISTGGAGGCYRLTNDIYLNDPTKINWSTGEVLDEMYAIRTWYQYIDGSPNNVKPFQGTLDGTGHVIYGLYIKNDYNTAKQSKTSAGLFPLIAEKANVSISNLGIDYAYIKNSNAAAFVGSISPLDNLSDYVNTLSARKNDVWEYSRNHYVLNFGDKIDTNMSDFTPISRLQLLAFNTGESYPFADRLVEYLSKSAITPVDEISDNIKRAQKVMKQNQHYFKIEGLWENKMQKIIYDYIMNSGPIEVETISIQKDDPENYGKAVDPAKYTGRTKQKLVDRRRGYQSKLGHISKSTLYDVLGYIDKDAEKWYASRFNDNGQAKIRDSIQNVDIYNGLFDI